MPRSRLLPGNRTPSDLPFFSNDPAKHAKEFARVMWPDADRIWISIEFDYDCDMIAVLYVTFPPEARRLNVCWWAPAVQPRTHPVDVALQYCYQGMRRALVRWHMGEAEEPEDAFPYPSLGLYDRSYCIRAYRPSSGL